MRRNLLGTIALLATLSFAGTACTEREAEVDRGVGLTEPAEDNRLSGGVGSEEGEIIEQEREIEVED